MSDKIDFYLMPGDIYKTDIGLLIVLNTIRISYFDDSIENIGMNSFYFIQKKRFWNSPKVFRENGDYVMRDGKIIKVF